MSMLYSRLNIFSFKNIENNFFSLQANVVEQVCIIQNNIYLKSIHKNIKVVIGLFLTHAHSTMNKNKKKTVLSSNFITNPHLYIYNYELDN